MLPTTAYDLLLAEEDEELERTQHGDVILVVRRLRGSRVTVEDPDNWPNAKQIERRWEVYQATISESYGLTPEVSWGHTTLPELTPAEARRRAWAAYRRQIEKYEKGWP